MTPEERSSAQALCLAAVVESALVVDELARTGSAPDDAIETLLASLFRFEWSGIAEVWGGVYALRRGLRVLESALERLSDAGRPQVLRYVLMLLRLGRQLASDHERLATIRERLLRMGAGAVDDPAQRERQRSAIAAIYKDTISTYRLRIRVSGDAAHLRNERVAELIRGVLLAGLRAVVLWRFVGGSGLGLLLGRGELLKACRKLAATAQPS